MVSEDWQEGYDARKGGYDHSFCPHSSDTVAYEEWTAGWTQADTDLRYLDEEEDD